MMFFFFLLGGAAHVNGLRIEEWPKHQGAQLLSSNNVMETLETLQDAVESHPAAAGASGSDPAASVFYEESRSAPNWGSKTRNCCADGVKYKEFDNGSGNTHAGCEGAFAWDATHQGWMEKNFGQATNSATDTTQPRSAFFKDCILADYIKEQVASNPHGYGVIRPACKTECANVNPQCYFRCLNRREMPSDISTTATRVSYENDNDYTLEEFRQLGSGFCKPLCTDVVDFMNGNKACSGPGDVCECTSSMWLHKDECKACVKAVDDNQGGGGECEKCRACMDMDEDMTDVGQCLKEMFGKNWEAQYLPATMPKALEDLIFPGLSEGNATVFGDWTRWSNTTLITLRDSYLFNMTWCAEEVAKPNAAMEYCAVGSYVDGSGNFGFGTLDYIDKGLGNPYSNLGPSMASGEVHANGTYCTIKGLCECQSTQEKMAFHNVPREKEQEYYIKMEDECNKNPRCTMVCGACWSRMHIEYMGLDWHCAEAQISQPSAMCTSLKAVDKTTGIFTGAFGLPNATQKLVPPLLYNLHSGLGRFSPLNGGQRTIPVKSSKAIDLAIRKPSFSSFQSVVRLIGAGRGRR